MLHCSSTCAQPYQTRASNCSAGRNWCVHCKRGTEHPTEASRAKVSIFLLLCSIGMFQNVYIQIFHIILQVIHWHKETSGIIGHGSSNRRTVPCHQVPHKTGGRRWSWFRIYHPLMNTGSTQQKRTSKFGSYEGLLLVTLPCRTWKFLKFLWDSKNNKKQKTYFIGNISAVLFF